MPERRIALLIGNGKFEAGSGFSPLRCPGDDVRGMRDMLTQPKHGGFQTTCLVEATQREILTAVRRTLSEATEREDMVVLYYSGHGSPDEDGSLYLAASDSAKSDLTVTAVSMELVVRLVRRAQSEKIVMIFDCCYSGAVERLFTKGEVADQVKTALPRELSGNGTYILTASTDTQLAEEKESDEYSLLTKHIIGGIRDGLADDNEDGIVTTHELLRYVQGAVRREGAQEPMGFALRMGGGDLVFARTGKTAHEAKRKEVQEAIFNSRQLYHVPVNIVRCVLDLVSEEATERAGEAGRRRLERLHSVLDDSGAFVEMLYELNIAVERDKELKAHEEARPDGGEATRAAAQKAVVAEPAPVAEKKTVVPQKAVVPEQAPVVEKRTVAPQKAAVSEAAPIGEKKTVVPQKAVVPEPAAEPVVEAKRAPLAATQRKRGAAATKLTETPGAARKPAETKLGGEATSSPWPGAAGAEKPPLFVTGLKSPWPPQVQFLGKDSTGNIAKIERHETTSAKTGSKAGAEKTEGWTTHGLSNAGKVVVVILANVVAAIAGAAWGQQIAAAPSDVGVNILTMIALSACSGYGVRWIQKKIRWPWIAVWGSPVYLIAYLSAHYPSGPPPYLGFLSVLIVCSVSLYGYAAQKARL